MEGWFSKTEGVQTGNATVDYHPETLGWTLGSIAFCFIGISAVYFYLRYRKMRTRNMIAAIHLERDRQGDMELTTIRQTIGNDAKLQAASSMWPNLLSPKSHGDIPYAAH